MAPRSPVLLDERSRYGGAASGGRSLQVAPGFAARLLQRLSLPPGEREVLPVRAPFTGETVAEVPAGEMGDVFEAVKQARHAFAAWAATPVRLRQRPFQRFHEIVLRQRDEVLDLIQIETGKTRRDALEEVVEAALVARHYGFHARRLLRPERRAGAIPLLTRVREAYRPRGVVGLITPWCSPLGAVASELIPALVAGNSVVVKPARQGSLSALWLVDRLVEAGVPAGVIRVVTGRGALLGPSLVDRSDFVAFAGSTLVGRRVARDAADALVGYSLDLAGANALVVLRDAAMEPAVDGAIRACFAGAGQRALGVRQVLVDEPVYDRFLSDFAGRAAGLCLGADLDFGIDVGSLGSSPQLASVHERVVDAACRGARVAAGGRARPDIGPLFYEPTILTNATPDMALLRVETLGPIAAVSRVRDAEEAVQAINRTGSGLNVSIWTADRWRARTFARQLRAGIVSVNDAYLAALTAPDASLGGFKTAGLGRRHGAAGLRKYTEAQVRAERRGIRLGAPVGISEQVVARAVVAILRLSGRLPRFR